MSRLQLSAKFRVAMGQVSLLVSLILVALLLGLIPDRQSAIRQGRAALTEAIALDASVFITNDDIRRLRAKLKLLVERNDDLLSAAVRQTGFKPIVVFGDHEAHWTKMSGEHSSDTQVRVAIFSGTEKWGQLELRFRSSDEFAGLSFANSQITLMVGFIACSSFVIFYMYLGKMLKHLDPSRAIPPRVRSALDTMAEGLVGD